MPRQVFCSTAVQVLLCCASATYVLCTHPGDPNLKLLLQKGVDQGYPGIAVLIQSADGRTQSAAAGYSDLENHTPMRVEDAFHIASINKIFTAGRGSGEATSRSRFLRGLRACARTQEPNSRMPGPW